MEEILERALVLMDSSDAESDDDYLARQIARTPDTSRDKFRPGLADDNFLGFFSTEHATQTDESEIVAVKEMTENVQQLLTEASEMKRTLAFIYSTMQADFDAKLRQKSIDLYVRLNDRMSCVEKMHAEKMDTIRRAYRQQLNDAISQITSYYTSDVSKRLASEQMQSSTTAKRLKELEALAKANEALIRELQAKLAFYDSQALAREAEASLPKDDGTATTAPSHRDRASSIELANCRDEIANLEAKLASLEDDMMAKEDECSDLRRSLESSNADSEKLKREIDTLKKSKEALMAALENHQQASAQALENQRLAFERENEIALKRFRSEAAAARKSAPKQPEPTKPAEQPKDPNVVDKQVYEKLLKEKKALEESLTQEQTENLSLHKTLKEFRLAQKKEALLVDQVNRLKSELVNLEKNWQKKFLILQQSMFALKDESYLRQTLQKQSATLHQAAVSYAYDGPVGSKTGHSTGGKKILPGILRQKSMPQDYISYTISPPCDGKTLTSLDENQILSDDEDLPAGVRPLPSPPNR